MTKGAETPRTRTTSFDLFTAMATVDLSQPMDLLEKHDDDKVVGTLSENLHRIAAVELNIRREQEGHLAGLIEFAKSHAASHGNDSHSREDCDAATKELQEREEVVGALTERINLVVEIFWKLAQLEFPEITRLMSQGRQCVLANDLKIVVGQKPTPTPKPRQSIILASALDPRMVEFIMEGGLLERRSPFEI